MKHKPFILVAYISIVLFALWQMTVSGEYVAYLTIIATALTFLYETVKGE
jgi:Na+/melibiose symporter-like transporter